MPDAADQKINKNLKKLYLQGRKGFLSIFGALLGKDQIALPPSFKNILFIRTDRIGDMVLSTPALTAIKVRWPEARLTVLASPINACVLKNNTFVDEVIVYPAEAPFAIRRKVFEIIRRRDFDLAVDPYDDYELKTAWLAWRSGAALRIGYEIGGRDNFFNGPTLPPKGGRHFVDTALDLLGLIGCPTYDRQPGIFLNVEECCWADTWLKERNLGRRPLLAIHPGGHYETQRWPPEYYAALLRLLSNDGGVDIIVFGTTTETKKLEAIISETPSSRQIYYFDNDLRRFFALLYRCRLLICNNSGPLHCATALGVPTISFMGPTEKDRWYPLGKGHLVLRRDDLPCIGCGQGRCPIKTQECMRSILPSEVLEFIKNLISN